MPNEVGSSLNKRLSSSFFLVEYHRMSIIECLSYMIAFYRMQLRLKMVMIDSTLKTEDTTKGSFQLERQLKDNLKADLKNSTLKTLDI